MIGEKGVPGCVEGVEIGKGFINNGISADSCSAALISGVCHRDIGSNVEQERLV